MVSIINGDLLMCEADVICHQVNLDGVMGGGLAYSIARKYPEVDDIYKKYRPKKLGEVCFAETDDFVIANCFSQDEDFNTNYFALENCLRKVRKYMKSNGYKSVAIPYHYGCGIANGNWDKVYNIFVKVFKGFNVTIYRKQGF